MRLHALRKGGQEMIFGSLFQKPKRIGIFGGSFNPPHVGHSAICQWCLQQKRVDEVWVIPCFEHPFGKVLAPYDHRIAMCRLAFPKIGPRVRILDVERQLGGTSFTLRTVQHLRKLHTAEKFCLITGEDIHDQSDLWQDFAKIKHLVEVISVPRGKHSPIPDVSSTEIRRRIEAREPYNDLIESEIAIYIVTKGLYR